MDEKSFVIWMLIQQVDKLETRVDGLETRTYALEKFEHEVKTRENEVKTRENRETQSRNWLTSKVGMWAAIAVAFTSVGSLIIGILTLLLSK